MPNMRTDVAQPESTGLRNAHLVAHLLNPITHPRISHRQDGGRQVRAILRAGLPDCHCRDRNARRHLRHREQGILASQGTCRHRHSDNREHAPGRNYSRKVGGSTRGGDENLEPASFRPGCPGPASFGVAVRRANHYFVRDAVSIKDFATALHCGPVGFASHDDADQRGRLRHEGTGAWISRRAMSRLYVIPSNRTRSTLRYTRSRAAVSESSSATRVMTRPPAVW